MKEKTRTWKYFDMSPGYSFVEKIFVENGYAYVVRIYKLEQGFDIMGHKIIAYGHTSHAEVDLALARNRYKEYPVNKITSKKDILKGIKLLKKLGNFK